MILQDLNPAVLLGAKLALLTPTPCFSQVLILNSFYSGCRKRQFSGSVHFLRASATCSS
jgi:hypothetical protein